MKGEKHFRKLNGDEQFQNLMDFATELSERKFTKEEALRQLVNAGILDLNGNFTEPYKALQEYMPTASK